jgi:hypothetical protein
VLEVGPGQTGIQLRAVPPATQVRDQAVDRLLRGHDYRVSRQVLPGMGAQVLEPSGALLGAPERVIQETAHVLS